MPESPPQPAAAPPYEIIILVVYFCIGFGSLTTILARDDRSPPQVQSGWKAYGPEDFKDKITWDVKLLDAIQNGKKEGAPTFPVPPPPFSDEDIYPCSECHEDLETNPKPHKLEQAHQNIVLHHGAKDRWCFDCHNPDDRDKLRLANGKLVGFDESYRLCGQCHGTIYRDWRRGIHGRRRGYWDGPKSYLLCPHCHNPHAPRFKPLKPLPPPVRPQFLRPADKGHS